MPADAECTLHERSAKGCCRCNAANMYAGTACVCAQATDLQCSIWSKERITMPYMRAAAATRIMSAHARMSQRQGQPRKARKPSCPGLGAKALSRSCLKSCALRRVRICLLMGWS